MNLGTTTVQWHGRLTFVYLAYFSGDCSRLGQVLQRRTLGIAESRFFTGWMPILSPKQQCQGIE